MGYYSKTKFPTQRSWNGENNSETGAKEQEEAEQSLAPDAQGRGENWVVFYQVRGPRPCAPVKPVVSHLLRHEGGLAVAIPFEILVTELFII